FAVLEENSKPRLMLMSNGSPSSKASITLVTSPDSIMTRGSVAVLGSSAHAAVGASVKQAKAVAAPTPPTDQAGKVRMITLRSDASDATGGRLRVSTPSRREGGALIVLGRRGLGLLRLGEDGVRDVLRGELFAGRGEVPRGLVEAVGQDPEELPEELDGELVL